MALPEDNHDILVIPKDGRLYRIECDNNGGYDKKIAQQFSPKDHGQRRSLRIARPGGTSSGGQHWGPAFATVPKKAEPATSQVCCYVVNSENVRVSNPWTQAAWSSEPVRPEARDPNQPNASLQTPVPEFPETLEFLVAGSIGSVYHFSYQQGAPTATVKPLQLNLDVEVYGALRNGLVAGSAPVGRTKSVVPLINLTALIPDAPPSTAFTSANLATTTAS